MGAGKEEDGRQAEQGEVHAHILATDQAIMPYTTAAMPATIIASATQR